MKVRKGDKVIVLAGADKGKTGAVTEVNPQQQRVVVEGVNVRKRHLKPTTTRQQGGVVEEPQPIHVSNVALLHPNSKDKGSRVGFKFKKDGSKVRVYRQAGNKEVK